MSYYRTALKLATSAIVFTLAAFITSCQKDKDPYSAEVTQTFSSEAAMDAQQDEVDDIATAQLNGADPAGRIAFGNDGRVACAYISGVVGDNNLSGTIDIDFDHNSTGGENPSGCTDARGNIRKGKITISWTGGRWFHAGAIITVELTNYSINGVVINGTRTLTNVTTVGAVPTWRVVAEHSATWPDNSTATRNVHKTKSWDIIEGTITVVKTDGAANAVNGTNRHGTFYTVQITDPVVFKISCILTYKVYLPVQGQTAIAFNNKEVILDFGDGNCDEMFLVTFEHTTKSVEAINGSKD